MLRVDLKGQRAIVTGGGRGIGRALALGLARNGADLVVVYHAHPKAAEQTAWQAERHGVRALAVAADTGEPEQVAAMVDQVCARLGGIDILVNNAGVLEPGALSGAQLRRVAAGVAH